MQLNSPGNLHRARHQPKFSSFLKLYWKTYINDWRVQRSNSGMIVSGATVEKGAQSKSFRSSQNSAEMSVGRSFRTLRMKFFALLAASLMPPSAAAALGSSLDLLSTTDHVTVGPNASVGSTACSDASLLSLGACADASSLSFGKAAWGTWSTCVLHSMPRVAARSLDLLRTVDIVTASSSGTSRLNSSVGSGPRKEGEASIWTCFFCPPACPWPFLRTAEWPDASLASAALCSSSFSSMSSGIAKMSTTMAGPLKSCHDSEYVFKPARFVNTSVSVTLPSPSRWTLHRLLSE
mmetsp:Transcript_90267/g.264047  ORF Transcript_90267/g.264047 Transcript_90267/m.264047 type:complete len:293 (-) Transcript_90267:432-1310(-)